MRGSLALTSLIVLHGSIATSIAMAQVPRLLEVQLAEGVQAGLPIHWDSDLALLLKPTGSMLEVPISNVRRHRVLEEPFVPQSLTAARAMLQMELGNAFETSTVGPYVLCTPRGHADRWRERFRVLLAGYNRYFETRGWQLRTPAFPLCVVILPNKSEFDRYCQEQLGRPMPNLMGYYFPKSNRCALFEVGGGTSSTDWTETQRTIVHEAIHQLAYNTGVHERLADNPLWVVEGLATMFEEPAIFDARLSSRSVEARINGQQMQTLRRFLTDPVRMEAQLTELIESNELFKSDTQSAYALSWALSFYLAERMSSQYGAYSQKLAQLGKLKVYSRADRARDFSRAFEADIRLIAIQMQRFYTKLDQ